MSWDAVKEKLKTIIDNEDGHNPLNDDEIVEKLKAQGIELGAANGREVSKDPQHPHRAATTPVLTPHSAG